MYAQRRQSLHRFANPPVQHFHTNLQFHVMIFHDKIMVGLRVPNPHPDFNLNFHLFPSPAFIIWLMAWGWLLGPSPVMSSTALSLSITPMEAFSLWATSYSEVALLS